MGRSKSAPCAGLHARPSTENRVAYSARSRKYVLCDQSVDNISILFFIFSDKPEEERKPTLSASELLKAHEKDVKRKNSRSTSTSAPPVQTTAPDTPMLGRGLAPGSDLFFDESPNIKKRKSNDVERAKVPDVNSFFRSYMYQFKLFFPFND